MAGWVDVEALDLTAVVRQQGLERFGYKRGRLFHNMAVVSGFGGEPQNFEEPRSHAPRKQSAAE